MNGERDPADKAGSLKVASDDLAAQAVKELGEFAEGVRDEFIFFFPTATGNNFAEALYRRAENEFKAEVDAVAYTVDQTLLQTNRGVNLRVVKLALGDRGEPESIVYVNTTADAGPRSDVFPITTAPTSAGPA